jgi:hypothetical protein
LVNKGLLKPLGHPAHNGQKYFLTATLEDLRRDFPDFLKDWIQNPEFAQLPGGESLPGLCPKHMSHRENRVIHLYTVFSTRIPTMQM